ncbi:uncharacterized protein LOC133338594 [Musca vetustissima]|uniref:uncharacterized protein LOC133338594 n=1 Tax=Musca vetustissima TaxID=27455 RepID=UPI002AB6A67E|nr:uncharacterized protein LOC133338594 [Musca vetustissima]
MSKGKKRSVWCDIDTHHLLQLWEERANDLRRAKRNGHIYQDIAAQMNHKFTAEVVHVKIRNFTIMRKFWNRFYFNHPETSPLSPSPQPYLDVVFPPATPSSSSSAKKRNNLGEVIKIMKEQNDMLKCVLEDSQCLSNQIVSAIREQNETSREFIILMKNLIDKI